MDSSLSTITATEPIAWSWLVGLGALSGLIAAVVMDWPMSRQPDGFTPAAIATGILSRQSVDEVSMAQLLVVHHSTGLLAGVFYSMFAIGATRNLPVSISVAGLDLVAHLLAVGFVTGVIYGFFAHFVLPRAGGSSYEQQATAIRGQWLRSSLVFGVTMLLVVPLILLSVGS